jgi:hypothetical protein
MWKRIVLATTVLLLVVFTLPGCDVSQGSPDNLASLKASLDNLTATNTQLTSEQQVSEALRIGHLLADYYDEVRDANSTSSWWGATSTLQGKVKFAADLARHGLGQIYWVDYENTYFRLAKEHSYTTARRDLDGVLNVIGISSTDLSIQKIDKVLDFISAHITYENDMNEAYLAPMETLGFLSGDCDDYAILAAALFEAVGIDSAVGFFNNGSSSHAMTLVHLDDISPYGCWYYSNLTSYGLQAGTWLKIEPQATIENQMTDWVHQWSIEAAAEV